MPDLAAAAGASLAAAAGAPAPLRGSATVVARPRVSSAVLVALVEFLGGIALVLGFLTRLWAILLGVVMVVAILGVQDMTQLTRLYYSGNFLYMQSLTMLAFMYLIMVVMLTRLVRWMEGRLQRAYRN